MGAIKHEIARAAARWWGRQLRDEEPLVDNGDFEQSVMGSINRNRALDGIASEQISEFEDILTEMLEGEGITGRDRYIKCDYGPHPLLADAAEEAGIENVGSIFPWKTGMWIEENRVLVSEGYQSDREEVYTTSAWPPATNAVLADLEISFHTSKDGAESFGPLYMIEDAPKEFDGFTLTIRHIEDVTATDTKEVEGRNSPRLHVEASVSGALVFATNDYYEKRRYQEYGDSPEQIARAAFEAYEHIGLVVHEVDGEDLGPVNPINPVETIL